MQNLKSEPSKRISFNINDDVLSDVNKEVISWAKDKKEEIERLKEQEAFRREFLGNLAHELKTPVFSIQGYLLTLLEGGLEDDSVNRDFLLRASKGVDRMTHIIEDLDEINKFESGRMPLEIEQMDLVELIENTFKSLELLAESKKIKLSIKNRDKYTKLMVLADVPKLEQVLINLLSNSISYGNTNGNTEVRFNDMDEVILVEVADDGLGIAEKHLSRLFERFYRVDKSRSRHEGGSGLGLAIVKHILEAHHQSINVRSTEDVGTTFSFTIQKAKSSK